MGSSQDGSSPRESIMLPLLTSLTKPSVQSRRIPCTHLQLTRLYGMHRCSHCFQTPMLGWVYRCVQDHHGELPLWENGCGNWSMVSQHETFLWDSVKEPDPHLNLSQLSPWIEQAIIDGHYTTAQVAVLKVQRERVVQSISIAESNHSLLQRLENFREGQLYDDGGQDSLEEGCSSDDIAQATKEKILSPPTPSSYISISKIYPDCTYTTCQACRPTSRDRSWECFDHVFEEPSKGVPNFSTDNRPISPAHIVRNLALIRGRSRLRTFDSTDMFSGTRDDKGWDLDYASPTDSDSNADEHGIARKKRYTLTGVGHGLRRTFRNILLKRPRSTDSKDGRVSAASRLSKSHKMDSMQDMEQEPKENIVGLFRDPEIIAFLEDRGQSLPGHDGGDCMTKEGETKEQATGKVNVAEGIPVSEETDGFGFAEVITQA